MQEATKQILEVIKNSGDIPGIDKDVAAAAGKLLEASDAIKTLDFSGIEIMPVGIPVSVYLGPDGNRTKVEAVIVLNPCIIAQILNDALAVIAGLV